MLLTMESTVVPTQLFPPPGLSAPWLLDPFDAQVGVALLKYNIQNPTEHSKVQWTEHAIALAATIRKYGSPPAIPTSRMPHLTLKSTNSESNTDQAVGNPPLKDRNAFLFLPRPTDALPRVVAVRRNTQRRLKRRRFSCENSI